MDARHEKGRPDTADAQYAIKDDILDPHSVRGEHHAQERHADAEVDQRNLGRVEQGNDHHGAKVVDDGQRREKDFGRKRDTVAQDVDDGQREGDIGGHGDAPAACGRRAGIQDGINQSRHEHSGHRRTDGQHGVTGVCQFAADELPFQFEPHHEKEHRHEAVVNPVMKRIVEVWLAVDHEAELMFKEVEISVAPRGVGQRHSHHDAEAKHDARRLFTLDKLLQGHDDAPADPLFVVSCHDVMAFRGKGRHDRTSSRPEYGEDRGKKACGPGRGPIRKGT